jgi:hypothetical protein
LDFDDENQNILDRAYKSKQVEVKLIVKSHHYLVDLENMTQKNSKTKKLRKIQWAAAEAPMSISYVEPASSESRWQGALEPAWKMRKENRSDLKVALEEAHRPKNIMCTESCRVPVPNLKSSDPEAPWIKCGAPCALDEGHKEMHNCLAHTSSWDDEDTMQRPVPKGKGDWQGLKAAQQRPVDREAEVRSPSQSPEVDGSDSDDDWGSQWKTNKEDRGWSSTGWTSGWNEASSSHDALPPPPPPARADGTRYRPPRKSGDKRRGKARPRDVRPGSMAKAAGAVGSLPTTWGFNVCVCESNESVFNLFALAMMVTFVMLSVYVICSYLSKKSKVQTTQKRKPSELDEKRNTVKLPIIYFCTSAVARQRCFHSTESCAGLRRANSVNAAVACKLCVGVEQGTSASSALD